MKELAIGRTVCVEISAQVSESKLLFCYVWV